MKRLKYLLMAGVITAMSQGCSDDPEIKSFPSGVEISEGGRVSVFSISASGDFNVERIENVVFELTDPSARKSYTFAGSVDGDRELTTDRGKGAAICRMLIGLGHISDGNYFLTIKGEGLPEIGTRRVRFENNVGTEEDYTPYVYEYLDGDGTADSPYIIGSAGDYLCFLAGLKDDPDCGFGRYFRQEDSFDLPARSEIIDGRVWYSLPFSGNYDGNGNSLRRLTYQGASDPEADSEIGLFKSLFSATISNLSITDAFVVNASSKVGLLAGSAGGNTTVSNLTVGGTVIASGNYLGGVFGKVDGNLAMSGITLKSLAVSGDENSSENIGLIAGGIEDCTFNLTGVTAPDHVFSATGRSNVGGVAGEIKRSKTDVSNVILEHSVDEESQYVKVIYASSGYAGGFAGWIENKDGSKVRNISLKCPVRSPQDAGGFAGHAVVDGILSLEKVVLSSVVSGDVSTGGFFGYLGLVNTSSHVDFNGEDNGSRYVVKNSAAAGVSGGRHVGGIAGFFETNRATLRFNSKVEIAVNVTGTSYNVGGAFGYIRNANGQDISNINFSSGTMRVTGGDQGVGGIVGCGDNCIMKGSNSLDLLKHIPSKDELEDSFHGVVSGERKVGGFAGIYSGEITGVASSASVTAASTDAGGIVGDMGGKIFSSAFYGSVSTPKTCGGVVAYANPKIHLQNCVNLADISTGEWQAGILAYTNSALGVYVIVDRCVNMGNLTNGIKVGGIAGYFKGDVSIPAMSTPPVITDCCNYGDIYAAGDSSSPVAGIVARIEFKYVYTIKGNANHGDVGSSKVQYVIGGVVGDIGTGPDNEVMVEQCMNSGRIFCDVSSTKLGGVVGFIHAGEMFHNKAIIRDCYNTGIIDCDQKDDTGGILAYASSFTDTHRTFNRGKISHGNAIIGTHASGSTFYHSHNYYLEGTGGGWPSSTKISGSDIADEKKYGDFDFEKVWKMTPDGPVLRNCPFQ